MNLYNLVKIYFFLMFIKIFIVHKKIKLKLILEN